MLVAVVSLEPLEANVVRGDAAPQEDVLSHTQDVRAVEEGLLLREGHRLREVEEHRVELEGRVEARAAEHGLRGSSPAHGGAGVEVAPEERAHAPELEVAGARGHGALQDLVPE